jgi:hypothetical protein
MAEDGGPQIWQYVGCCCSIRVQGQYRVSQWKNIRICWDSVSSPLVLGWAMVLA